MSDDKNDFDKTGEQWAAFQKIWGDTFTRLMQAGFTFSPDAAPPEILRQIRSGIFQALSQSWDEFLRSPQFLETTKQWMNAATSFRKMTTDFLTKAQHEAQSPAREDIDNILQSVRQVESRILDRLEDLTKEVNDLKDRAKTGPARSGERAGRKTARKPKARTTGTRAAPRKPKR